MLELVRAHFAFNRTRLELKLEFRLNGRTVRLPTFNRTRLELKLSIKRITFRLCQGLRTIPFVSKPVNQTFNRTRLELKLRDVQQTIKAIDLWSNRRRVCFYTHRERLQAVGP